MRGSSNAAICMLKGGMVPQSGKFEMNTILQLIDFQLRNTHKLHQIFAIHAMNKLLFQQSDRWKLQPDYSHRKWLAQSVSG